MIAKRDLALQNKINRDLSSQKADLTNKAKLATDKLGDVFSSQFDGEQLKTIYNSLKPVKNGTDNIVSITIPNTSGATISNCTIRLALHKGTAEGDTVWNEVFDANFRDDFTGLRFFDADSKELPYNILNHGNYDFIRDTKLRQYGNEGVFRLSTGEIVLTSNADKKVRKTTNNGSTFVNLGSIDIPGLIRFVDSNDNVYVQNDTYQIVKYSNPAYDTGTVVLDLSSTSSSVFTLGFAEDSNGYIYAGTYQEAWIGAKIFRSTDGGNTFTKIYENTDVQHVHHICINKNTTPNEIYVGLDNASTRYGPLCIKSVDSGITWTEVPVPYRNRDYAFRYFGDGYKLGCGEANILGGYTLYKTTDENNPDAYKVVLNTNQGIRNIISPVEGILIAGGCAGGTNKIGQLYMSTDDGETWETIYTDEAESNTSTSAGNGYRFFTDYFTPSGATEAQVIASGYGRKYGLRCYFGGSRRSAIVYVNVGDVPNGGKTISMYTNYLISTSNIKDTVTDMVSHTFEIKLNEGFGEKTKTTNGVKLVNGIREWESINYSAKSGMIPALHVNRFGAIFEDNAYAEIGTIPLAQNKNFSLGFWIKTPSNSDIVYDGTIKQYILNSNAISIYIKGRGLTFNIDGKEATIHLPDTIWYTTNSWQYCIVTVDNSTLPALKAYTYDKLEKSATASQWGTTKFINAGEFTFGKKTYDVGETAYAYGICDIRLYNRCLTYDEVVALNQGRYYLIYQN